ncbi:MAG: RNA polymerase sigma factor [Candidatus Andeanibacterium colombiense]|uniref:RNA polymerase sigma factor n=1 Tax=Candidatus Andeanibacterium colombiense TaxID=3121345 RepID=A0AAJ6BLA5_9SPHN|nr:MAG: RNA polymerase sigma factor [Sphingomonadaceae bacterium]
MPPAAAAQGIEIYWDELAAFLTRRVGDPALAADLTQEAYLRAAGLPDNATLLNPRAWLFATARNLVIDHARRAKLRHAAGEDALAGIADECPAADAVLLAREELAVLAAAVEALPPRTREVFRLHKYEGRSYSEIAEQLGIAKNTVMVHMVKALALCREAMRAHREIDGPANASPALVRLPTHEP